MNVHRRKAKLITVAYPLTLFLRLESHWIRGVSRCFSATRPSVKNTKDREKKEPLLKSSTAADRDCGRPSGSCYYNKSSVPVYACPVFIHRTVSARPRPQLFLGRTYPCAPCAVS
ncbi:hypothetical protein EVAR_68336_1 [Eumeta japonica]|uniref:Uncharacterized protein n=1 Tax=Eumeta variegata TaxID=151549 RepID=A0A4C2A606_EUMVA|nr:hypothetical protein EVAR_68336_1 [Eumeta japonica]